MVEKSVATGQQKTVPLRFAQIKGQFTGLDLVHPRPSITPSSRKRVSTLKACPGAIALRVLRINRPNVLVAAQLEGLRQRSLDIALVSEPPTDDDPDLLGIPPIKSR
jgi:hypothetical protein